MIRPLLLQIRRRLAWQAFSRYAVRYGVAAGMALFGVMLFAPRHTMVGAAILSVVTLLGAAISVLLTRPSLAEVARQMDAVAGTKDRLITSLAFQEGAASGNVPQAWQQSALAECEAFLSKIDFFSHTPWRFPREGRWLPLPLAAIAAFSLFQHLPGLVFGEKGERPPDANVVKKADELEKMAEKMAQSGKEADKKIAEALKKAAEQLRSEATSESPEKAMLRELSALEQVLQEARKGNDLQNLAEAFEKAESLSRAAEALKKGETGTAADELEKAAQKLREMAERMQQEATRGESPSLAEQGEKSERGGQQGEQGDAREMNRFEKAMRAAARQMGEKSPVGEAAKQAADSAQRREGQGMEQAMQRMAEAMRRSQQGQGDAGKAQAQIDASIARLREMKSAQQGEEGAKGQMAQAQGSGNEPGQGQNQPGSGEDAGGQAGSEHDEGSKASPYGKEQGEKAEKSLASQVQGIFGEGESLHSLTPTQGGKDEARRGYKALYEAAASEAEDALNQENIPIGSRLYVKRYFEAIRPKK